MGKNKNKLRPKNHENFKTASLGSNFTGSYEKKSVPQQEDGNHNSVIKGVLYRFIAIVPCFYIFRESYCLPSN